MIPRRSTFYRSWRPACAAVGLAGFNVRNLRHNSSSTVTSEIYTEIFEGRDREIADRLERLARDPDAQRRLRG